MYGRKSLFLFYLKTEIQMASKKWDPDGKADIFMILLNIRIEYLKENEITNGHCLVVLHFLNNEKIP